MSDPNVVYGPFPDAMRQGDSDKYMEEVGMDSALWWAPTDIDTEADMGGLLRTTKPEGDGGTLIPAKLIAGQAGDTDDTPTRS